MGCDTKGCLIRTRQEFCEEHAAEQIAMLRVEVQRLARRKDTRRIGSDLRRRLEALSIRLHDVATLCGSSDPPPKRVSPGSVPEDVAAAMAAVAGQLGTSVEGLRDGSRDRPLVGQRHLAWAAVRDLTGASLPTLGRAFGRHHTTIMDGIRQTCPETVRRLVAATSVRACPLDVRRIGPLDAQAVLRESTTSAPSGHVSSGHRRRAV